MTRLRGRLAPVVAAVIAVGGLSGCGTMSSALSSVNPFSSSAPPAAAAGPAARAAVCPQAVILRPLANTVVFGPGEGRRPINIAFSGRLSEVDVKCDFAGGAMRATFDVIIVAERGPAAGRAAGVDLNYFVAVTAPDQSILSKKNFPVHIDIPANAKRAAVTDHFEEAVNTGGQAPGDLTIDLGFQQSPAALEYYRTSGGR